MMNGRSTPQMNPYELHRSHGPMGATASSSGASMDYSENIEEASYVAASSVITAGLPYYQDATQTVHEMHLALLYLLSNPEEFQRALLAHPPRGSTTLEEWNLEYDESTVHTAEGPTTVGADTTPLPFVVFADDAEVVLPQAHTASQLFGIERMEGIELEAAAGVPALSQLFLRWLALMPGGDHINIIDPPGLTVMRIAGGRYRVTAAHRVVWTWMNEFASLNPEDAAASEHVLQVGDLVSMTIVDVFETDNNGKLLSYCPTFDNRDVRKTNQASETLKKSSTKIMSQLSIISKSPAAHRVNKGVAHVTRMGMDAARSVASSVKHRVDESMRHIGSPGSKKTDGSPHNEVVDAEGFENALNAAEANLVQPTLASTQSEDAGDVVVENEVYSDVQRV